MQAYVHPRTIGLCTTLLSFALLLYPDLSKAYPDENLDLSNLCVIRKKSTQISGRDGGFSVNIKKDAELVAIKPVSADSISRIQVNLHIEAFSSESDWESPENKKHREPFGIAVSFGKQLKQKCPNKLMFFIRQVLFYRLNKSKHPRTIVFFLAQDEPHLKLYESPTFPGRLYYCAYQIPKKAQEVVLDIHLPEIVPEAFGRDDLRVNAISLVSDLRDTRAQVNLTVEEISLFSQ